MSKWIGTTLILLAVILAAMNLNEFKWAMAGTGERFAMLVERDLRKLEKSNALPGVWDKIASVQFNATTEESKKWLAEAQPHIATNPKGEYLLEVDTTDWKEGHQYGGIAQFNLIEAETGNKIWELGRTYKIGPDSAPPKILSTED